MKIALIGKMRAGKTSVMEALIELGNRHFQNLRMSLPIYIKAQELFEEIGTPTFKNRRLLEGIGEIFNRHPEGDHLIANFKERLERLPKDAWIICDDARTIEQINFLRNLGFILVKIEAPEELRQERCTNAYEWSEGHYTDSEFETLEPDEVLCNEYKNKKELYNGVREMYVKFLKKYGVDK